VRLFLIPAFLLALAAAPAAEAQRRHRVSEISGASIVRLPPGTRVVSPATIAQSGIQPALSNPNGLRGGELLGGSGSTVESLLQQAPGLGFDATHQAAMERNLSVRALIDPVTQHRLALARELERGRRRFSGGFPILLNTTQIVIIQQPPVILLQEEPPAESRPRIETAGEVQPVVSREPAPPPPPPHRELDELVLVRADGDVVLAVAVSFGRDAVVYISPKGIRRTLALADLDLAATLQMNEDRGSRIALP